MAVITTGNHPKALWPGVKAFWGRIYNEHPLECKELFAWDSSRKNYEEDVQVTGFGLAPAKNEGGPVHYESESQGFVSRYVHAAYSLGYIVTKEELDDNLYEVVSKRRAQALAFSMRQTREIVSALVYDRSTNSSYVGGDGVELLSTAHPNSTGGTWQNELTTAADLSETSLEDLCVLIAGATNDRGLKIAIMPEKLIVPRQLMFEAQRILASQLQNDTANNAINALRSMNVIPGGFTVNHYLTDPDAWFVRTNCPRGMVAYDRVNTEFTQDNDFDTSNAKAKAYERYSVGWTDPRGLYGSPGV